MPITNTGCWTKNWDGVKRMWATKQYAAGLITFCDQATSAGAYSMNIPDVTPFASIRQGSDILAGNLTLRLGGEESSSTPSDTDYNIYGPITSGLSYVSVTNNGTGYNASTGIASAYRSVTIQNTSASTLTIYEWGLFTGVDYWTSSTTRFPNKAFLLYRGKLSEAVTLRQYETITISFTIQMQLDVPNT